MTARAQKESEVVVAIGEDERGHCSQKMRIWGKFLGKKLRCLDERSESLVRESESSKKGEVSRGKGIFAGSRNLIRGRKMRPSEWAIRAERDDAKKAEEDYSMGNSQKKESRFRQRIGLSPQTPPQPPPTPPTTPPPQNKKPPHPPPQGISSLDRGGVMETSPIIVAS